VVWSPRVGARVCHVAGLSSWSAHYRRGAGTVVAVEPASNFILFAQCAPSRDAATSSRVMALPVEELVVCTKLLPGLYIKMVAAEASKAKKRWDP